MKANFSLKNAIPPQEYRWIVAAANDKRTAILWLVMAISVFVSSPFLVALTLLPIVVLVPLLGVIDARTRHLPDTLTLALFLTGLVLSPYAAPHMALLSAVIAGGIFFALQYAFARFTGNQGLGMGDVKLIAALGAWVGILGLIPLVLAATFSALIYTWVTKTPKNRQIPFGPFLLVGGWVALFYQAPFWYAMFKLMGVTL